HLASAIRASIVDRDDLMHITAIEIEQSGNQPTDVHLFVAARNDHRHRALQQSVLGERNSPELPLSWWFLTVQQNRSGQPRNDRRVLQQNREISQPPNQRACQRRKYEVIVNRIHPNESDLGEQLIEPGAADELARI